MCTWVLIFLSLQTSTLAHGLDKIPDVQGYLVINCDGAVLAVSNEVNGKTCFKMIDQKSYTKTVCLECFSVKHHLI